MITKRYAKRIANTNSRFTVGKHYEISGYNTIIDDNRNLTSVKLEYKPYWEVSEIRFDHGRGDQSVNCRCETALEVSRAAWQNKLQLLFAHQYQMMKWLDLNTFKAPPAIQIPAGAESKFSGTFANIKPRKQREEADSKMKTPLQRLGLSKGDHVKVVKDDKHGNRYEVGDVLRVVRDDHTDCPMFAHTTADHEFFTNVNNIEPLKEEIKMGGEFESPASQIGLEVGDQVKSIIDFSSYCKEGDILELIDDDGTRSPEFENQRNGKTFYCDLEKIQPLTEVNKMLKIENVTLINGTRSDKLDNDQLFDFITSEKERIEHLEKLDVESKAVTALKEQHQANIKRLVEILDDEAVDRQ